MKKRLQERTALGLCLGLIFGFMLVLNELTPYAADDFVYMVSFDTKELLTSLSQIPASMYVHSQRMNGRLISHTLEQLFMLVPKGVFNLCNATVFTLLIYFMYRIVNQVRKTSPLLLFALFMALWCTMPVFGQVVLWQVGALNYLWALAGCLLFLFPYFHWYLAGTEVLTSRTIQILFCAAGFLFGMYSEMTSFVGIYLAGAMLVLSIFLKKRTAKTWLWLPLVFAGIGYCIMLAMPAEVTAKVAGGLDLSMLISNAVRGAGKLLLNCWHLLILWVIYFILGAYQKINRDRLLLSALFFTGAAGSVCMTIIASYFPARCLATATILLILAVAVLIPPCRENSVSRIACIFLSIWFVWACWIGTGDILDCHNQFKRRETIIAQEKAQGEQNLVLDIVIPETPYSPFWDLRDLSCEETETWPNSSMAKYYQVDSILGKIPE